MRKIFISFSVLCLIFCWHGVLNNNARVGYTSFHVAHLILPINYVQPDVTHDYYAWTLNVEYVIDVNHKGKPTGVGINTIDSNAPKIRTVRFPSRVVKLT